MISAFRFQSIDKVDKLIMEISQTIKFEGEQQVENPSNDNSHVAFLIFQLSVLPMRQTGDLTFSLPHSFQSVSSLMSYFQGII